ncbi:MAG TPA: transcriptional regulator GcvA [Gammaproteobacteria bacterium]|nr:transcriptional regulator GcvA [Gammaproteobacteria bacterium]
MNKLPPLKSLQAFEAAGRHLSFTEAARELNVTPGAISQQMRMLEEFLEVRLFKRLNRAIVLTDAGQVFLPLISRGFENFGEAVAILGDKRIDGPLTITAAASFISNWLIPRLGRFKRRHPDIDVRIDTSNRLVDFMHEDIDLGIRFGNGVYPELDTVFLFSYDLIPVCAPELMQAENGLEKISDLNHHTLLHSDYSSLDAAFPDWEMWLKVVGADDVDIGHGIYFGQADQLIQAAIDGQGVALIANVMVERAIAEGKLVQPFSTRLPVKMSYHLVTSPGKSRIAKVRAFREWVLEESAYLRASSDQLRGSEEL